MGDFYNVRMRDDERLHPIIRQISRVHHQDKSRHLAMGREIVKVLHGELHRKYPLERSQIFVWDKGTGTPISCPVA